MLVALAVSACAAGAPHPTEVRAQANAARAAAAAEPVPEPAAAPRSPPPRDPAARTRRARAALPPGSKAVLREPPQPSPFVVAVESFADPQGGDEVMLALVDVTTEPGRLIGRHDFAGGPVEAGDALALEAATGEPIVLVALRSAVESSTCGWWIRAGRPRFLCAPRIRGPSRHRAVGDALIESWSTDYPPEPLASPTVTGRMLRLTPAGRWSEVDSFRCLGRPLDDVLVEAGRIGVRRWQRDSIRRLTRVARHQSRTFADDRAVGLLRDAIAIDACDAIPWRLLGRLEFQRGNSEVAAATLAIAVSLDSHEPATLVDLADALVGLDVTTPEGREALALVGRGLERSASTRSLRAPGAGPKQLARALYESYLDRTADAPERHRSRRRRVERQLQVLY